MDISQISNKRRARDSRRHAIGGSAGMLFTGEYAGQKIALKQVQISQRPHLLDLLSTVPLSQSDEGDHSILLELKVLLSLRHPHIIPFLGICYDSEDVGCLYFVMTWAENGSLYDYIHVRQQKLSELQQLRILTEVAGGMQYLHAHDVIHRDLKTPNVLLDGALSALICDFGLSGITDTRSNVSARLGTELWASPEQFAGDHLKAETDVFSYGCMMWEVFFRTKPWHHRTFLTHQRRVKHMLACYEKKEYLPLSSKINGLYLPPHIKDIIEVCFQPTSHRVDFSQLYKVMHEQYVAFQAHQEPADPINQHDILYGRPDAIWKFSKGILDELSAYTVTFLPWTCVSLITLDCTIPLHHIIIQEVFFHYICLFFLS